MILGDRHAATRTAVALGAMFAAFFLWSSTFAVDGPSDVVRVGAYDNPPKISRAPDGTMTGFWAELAEGLAERAHLEIQWVWGSWEECLDNLESGRIDAMVDVGYSEERARRFVFSDETVMLSWSRLYVRAGDHRIKALPDLEGMRIGSLRGGINTDGPGGIRDLAGKFGLHCRIIEYPDWDSVFRDLERGNLDAGVANRDFGTLRAGDFKVRRTAIIFQPIRLTFAFSPRSALMPRLKDKTDRILRELHDDPDSYYYKLLAKYFESGVTERRVTPEWVAPVLRAAALLLLVVLAAFVVARLEIRRGRRKLENARRELAASEARYKEIFDSTGDAIFIHDIETGRLVDVNRAMLEIYKCTREEALTTEPGRFSSGVPPYTMEEAVKKVRAAAREPQLFEWQARDLEGRVFWVEVFLRPAEFAGRRWVIASVRDIDDRKRMEGELLKTAKLQSLGVLAGGIAHDFNNMLTAVMGNVSMAMEDLPDDNPVQPMLRDIESASQRARKLTQQLLTFAKGGDPVREVIRPEEVVREAADFVLRGSGTACSYEFDPDLWAADVDRGQIGQVIQNLVLNARQAMGDHGRISISGVNLVAGGRHWVRLTVCDEGPGFSPRDLDHACDPYYTTKAEGNGLGLSICHSIIVRHGGRIILGSAPGGGACVICDLPAAPNARPDKDAGGEGVQKLEGSVLVMDDDTHVRDMAVRMLQSFGCRVAEAAEGKEAVEAYASALESGRPYAAVLMDLTIPGGMGGQEAAERILALDPDARLIVSSGYSNDPVLANYRDYGYCAVVAKPYHLAELNAALKIAFSRGEKS